VKKPVLAALGVAGACVACCTIPLAISLLGGAAALGVTSWLVATLGISLEQMVLLGVASIAVLVWGARAWTRRHRAKPCASESSSASSCVVTAEAQGCGCAKS
jgi:hypothetical protein